MPESSAKFVITKYFDAITAKGDWKSSISDDVVFNMPAHSTRGRASYVEITGRFLEAVTGVKMKQTIIQGDRACVIAAYDLLSPGGNTSTKEVVEILSVKEGKISSSSIYFDTEDFKTFMAR